MSHDPIGQRDERPDELRVAQLLNHAANNEQLRAGTRRERAVWRDLTLVQKHQYRALAARAIREACRVLDEQ